jgi:3-phenylpropionate/trans-cinnamate dioxygenase ferredoxin subunit
MAKYIVATLDELPPGSRKIVEVAGRSIGVFNIAGDFYALRNKCPHQGGPLCEGKLSGLIQAAKPGEYEYSRAQEILRCPWHGWEFDIKTGQSWFDPAKTRVRRYEVMVEPGAVLEDSGQTGLSQPIKGPYIAETYTVSIEQQYIVVEIK